MGPCFVRSVLQADSKGDEATVRTTRISQEGESAILLRLRCGLVGFKRLTCVSAKKRV